MAAEITAVEARRGIAHVKEHWGEADQAWLLELPGDEAATVLLLAGDLGAVPIAEPRPELVPESTPTARTTDPPTSHVASEAVRIRAQSAKAALLLAHYDAEIELTDEEAAELAGVSLTSEYATRCSELRNLGLLEELEIERQGRSGMRRMASRITAAGRAYVWDAGWRSEPKTLFR